MLKAGDKVEIIKTCSGNGIGEIITLEEKCGELMAGKCGCYDKWKIYKTGGKMMQSLRDYFKKNQDMIITMALIIVIDQFIFNGALREKIKNVVEKMLGKIEKQQ